MFNTDAEVVNYITTLARNTGTNIDSWDLPEIFAGRNNALLRKPEHINKKFYEALKGAWNQPKKTTKAPASAAGREKNDPIRISDATLNKLAQARMKPVVSEWNRKIAGAKTTIKNYEKYADNAKKNLADLEKKKAALLGERKGNKVDIKREVRKILEMGWYSGFKIREGSFWFLTSDVQFSCNRVKYDLGRFAVRVNLKTFEVSIFPYKGNIFNTVRRFDQIKQDHVDAPSDRCHPFVNWGDRRVGTLCWGNGDRRYNELRKESKLCEILLMLKSLLTTNSDSKHFDPSNMRPNPDAKVDFYPA